MRSLKRFQLEGQLLVLLNSLALLAVLISTIILVVWKNSDRERKVAPALQERLENENRARLEMMEAGLQSVEREAKLLAETASGLFTYPESYRLAPIPGEYDFDRNHGVYCSVRNDGATALVLSGATSLNPDILRDIRLTEYLNPWFKKVATLSPSMHSIGLYTTDSLLRRYPWIDFNREFAAGRLKPNFQVAELPFFVKAKPEQNPERNALWEWQTGSSRDLDGLAVCSTPVFSGNSFKGVVAIELNIGTVFNSLVDGISHSSDVALLVSNQGLILWKNSVLRDLLRQSSDSHQAVPLGDVEARVESDLHHLLRSMEGPRTGFDSRGEWGIQIMPIRTLPMKLALAGKISSPGLADWTLLVRRQKNVILWIWLVGVVLVLVNTLWILRAGQTIGIGSQQLEDASSALLRRQFDAALVPDPRGVWKEVFERFNRSVSALSESIGQLPKEEGSQSAEATAVSGTVTDMMSLIQRVRILDCFSAGEPMDTGLSRLAGTLKDIFSAGTVEFLFLSSEGKFFRRQVPEEGGKEALPVDLPFETGPQSEWGSALAARQAVCWNNTPAAGEDTKRFSSLGARNFLLGPVYDNDRMLGAILLMNRSDGFDDRQVEQWHALQESLAKVMANLLQCEGYRKIDSLRREYCHELVNVVEGPLNRVKVEVQAIFSRLGKLTPYYKEHCENILFEIGKLYEIAHEARGLDEVPRVHQSGDTSS